LTSGTHVSAVTLPPGCRSLRQAQHNVAAAQLDQNNLVLGMQQLGIRQSNCCHF
jgi:hypothetical protein